MHGLPHLRIAHERKPLSPQLPANGAHQGSRNQAADESDPAALTFVENAGIWAITGFIAYSGDIGAAIFFHTIAPRFVLAWRRGDVGEIIRVVVDSADAAQVDTSAASPGDIVRVPIIADPDLSSHDILLLRTG